MKTKIIFGGRKLYVSSRHLGIDAPEWSKGYPKHHYEIMVSAISRNETSSFTTDYWSPEERMATQGLRKALECLCSEAAQFNEHVANFEKLSIDPSTLGDFLREKYKI